MRKHFHLWLLTCLLGALSLQACAPSPAGNSPDATALAATLSGVQSTVAAIQTNMAGSSPTPTFTETPTPSVTPFPTIPLVTSTAANATVINATLCCLGPGCAFVVSSAVLDGSRVLLVGRGNIDDWWVIQDPIYHDACWISQRDLQVDPGVNLSALTVFIAPASPTPTSTGTATPTKKP